MTSLAFLLASLAPLPAAAADKPKIDFGSVLYAEYGMDLTDGAGNNNQFDISRLYFIAKSNAGEHFAFRLTSDVSAFKDLVIDVPDGTGGTTSASATVDTRKRLFLKHAYAEWHDDDLGLKVRFGSADTPWIPYTEHFWGHRYAAKAFTDVTGLLHSADLGIHVIGSQFDKMVTWQLTLGNGEGYAAPEVDAGKTVQARLSFDPMAKTDGQSLSLSVHGTQDVPAKGVDPVSLGGAAVGYSMDWFLVWAEGTARSEAGVTGTGYSLTVMPRHPDWGAVYGRYDSWDPDSSASDDATQRIVAGASHTFQGKYAAALQYEQLAVQNTPSALTRGVYLKVQAGF